MAMSLMHLSFILLVVQNTALTIVSKYSRLVPGPKYKPSTAIFLVEILKFLLCCVMLLHTKKGNVVESARTLRFEVFADVSGLKKMAVLAFLYAFQNIMALFAYDYVDVATYQIVYQLKIITTALFMIVLLGRRFSFVQWCAMVALMVGVAICSYSRLPAAAKTTDDNQRSAFDRTRMIGISIMLGLAVNSGIAAAYFERVMKSHKSTTTLRTLDPLWTRNLQLSAVSILVTGVDVVRNFGDVWKDGFFYGFHGFAWAVIFLQAVGGLTVAAVVRYSDNVVKNFGTSFSLIFSCIISNYMFDQSAPWSFYFGVILVVVSVLVYGDKRFAVTEKPKADYEKVPTSDNHEIHIDAKSEKDSR